MRDWITLTVNIEYFPQNINPQNTRASGIAIDADAHCDQPKAFGGNCADLAANPHFRRQVEHLHDQGPRPVGEFLAEFGIAHGLLPEIRESLARYAAIPDDALDVTNGRCFPPDPIYAVSR